MAQFVQQDHHPAESAGVVGDAQWALYETVLDGAMEAHVPFALGGAFGLATYTGCARNTKDLDLYVLPEHCSRAIEVLTRLGLADYFEQTPYDREWIYRGTTGGMIIDIIWAMANHRAQVDGWWMSGPSIPLRGRTVKVLPAEAMLWDKLYILQRERCDWPDVLNLLYYQGDKLDWKKLLEVFSADRHYLTYSRDLLRRVWDETVV